LSVTTGVERFLRATVTPLGSSGRGARNLSTANAQLVLIVFQDLSEQMRILEMRSDFIANASHELRTPLASVRGFIETLQGPARHDEEARKRFLGIMALQAERMTRLIDDLLMLSRVEERAYLPPTDSTHLNDVIEDVVRALHMPIEDRKFSVAFDAPADDVFVKGDRDELFQVFQNLIENAIKYGHEGGRVDISIGVPKNAAQATVSIADDGPGISAEHLPRLTERFYRVNADHSRKVGGTGLGLAIVKHVLNRHGGSLTFESRVGAGTTAIVTLPISLK
jgi:two-component system, OmpR family, phosphate regulon sensor histidine kinase PhoR